MVYAGKLTTSDMIQMLADRMHLLPRYRQRVRPTPLGMGHPTWEDDPDFDLSNHVVEATLPAPGDDRTLSAFCGELFCELIDREHPLWHMTVIDGHESGNTVVFLKLHHAMVDGVSSVELIEVLHEDRPSNNPPPPPTAKWEPQKPPSDADRLRSAIADQTDTALDLFRQFANFMRPGEPSEAAQRFTSLARASSDAMKLLAKARRWGWCLRGPLRFRLHL